MAIEGLRRRTDRQATGGLGNIARAFAHRNYLVYVSGNSISLIGWWLERVAVGWLTWTLTHSGAWLGLISLADFLPVLFLAPFAGVLADRRDRVRIIRLTQWIGCVQASLLEVLVASDAMTIEILFALVLMLGIASGVAQPSRLALIPTLVDRESLASALAINSVIFNLARFIGPALAGIVIAEIGISAAFAANAVSYIAFQISLLNLRGLPPQPSVGRQNVLRASVEAFSYACRHSGIGPMLLLFLVTTIGTRGFIELFPGFADRVFGRGPQGLAMLTSTVGLGAICGASWMVLRSAITGVGAQTLIQAAVDIRMRGRIMALYGMIFRAGPAVGAVLMGTLSEYLGLRLALALGAIVSGSFWLATRFWHKSMAAGLECSPMGATEGRPRRPA